MARHTRQLLFYTWETKTKRVRFCCENGISYSLHGLHVFELFFGMRFFGHFCQYARHALTEIRLIWITIFSKLKNCLLVVTFHLMVRRYTDNRWFLLENAAYIPAMYWVSGFWMKINLFFFSCGCNFRMWLTDQTNICVYLKAQTNCSSLLSTPGDTFSCDPVTVSNACWK